MNSLSDIPIWTKEIKGLDAYNGKYLWITEGGERHGDFRIDIVASGPSGPDAGKYAVKLTRGWAEGGGWTTDRAKESGLSKSHSWYIAPETLLKAVTREENPPSNVFLDL